MDPLSITASSIAILSAVTASGGGFDKLLSLCKAPAEVLALSNEVQALRSLLVIVQNSLLQLQGTKTYQTNEEELTTLLRTVKDYVLDFEQTIEYRLKSAEASSQDGMPNISYSHWLRAAPEIERLRQRIQNARSDLNAGLMAINIGIGEAVRRTPVEIQSITITSDGVDGNLGILSSGSLDQPTRINAGSTRGPPMKPPQPVPRADEELDIPESTLSVSRPLPTTPSEPSTSILRTFGHRGNEYSSNHIIRVYTTISIQRCERFCQCQCHLSSHMKTPQWLRRTLGQLMFCYTNLIRTKPCNYSPCYRNPKKAHFIYIFPWWLASRALIASSIVDNLTGSAAGWTIRMPVVLSNNSRIWMGIYDENPDYLRRVFSEGWATPFVVDCEGWNLLHYAVDWGSRKMFDFLIEQGVPDDIETLHRETPAAIAFRRGMTSLFEYDIEDIADGLCLTPLHLALDTPALGLEFTYEFLKQHQADINAADKLGITPLHLASRRGNADVVRQLLDWEADVDLVNAEGKSAMHGACWGGNLECVELLLNAGGDVSLRDQHGQTPLFYFGGHSDCEAIVDMLIQRGASIQCADLGGLTPLHRACMTDKTNLVHTLISRGAYIDAIDQNGDSPMLWSVICDRARSIEALSQAAELNNIPVKWKANGYGRNALHFAALKGSSTTMKALAALDLVGLDPMAKDCDGDTPNACFYEYRDNFCTIVREPFDVEEAAWIALLMIVCEQNSIDPPTLDWHRGTGLETDDASVAESDASNEEGFAGALESLGE